MFVILEDSKLFYFVFLAIHLILKKYFSIFSGKRRFVNKFFYLFVAYLNGKIIPIHAKNLYFSIKFRLYLQLIIDLRIFHSQLKPDECWRVKSQKSDFSLFRSVVTGNLQSALKAKIMEWFLDVNSSHGIAIIFMFFFTKPSLRSKQSWRVWLGQSPPCVANKVEGEFFVKIAIKSKYASQTIFTKNSKKRKNVNILGFTVP